MSNNQTCYFPAGGVAKTNRPCNASAPVSHCCAEGSVCLDNAYCLNAGVTEPYTLSRGTCTDPTFQSDSCPQRCKDTIPSDGALVQYAPSGPSPGSGQQYCCVGYNQTNGNCSAVSLGQSKPFILPTGNVIWDWSSGSTQLPNTKAAMNESLPPPSAPAPAPSVIYLKDTSHDAAIGAGVGVPLSILLLAALAGIYIVWQQKRRIEKELALMHADSRLRSYESSEFAKSLPQLEGTPVAELPQNIRIPEAPQRNSQW